MTISDGMLLIPLDRLFVLGWCLLTIYSGIDIGSQPIANFIKGQKSSFQEIVACQIAAIIFIVLGLLLTKIFVGLPF